MSNSSILIKDEYSDNNDNNDNDNNHYASKFSKSCDACKSRKVKCDGIRPSCANCLKNSKECNYSLMKKPGLKSGYGKSLGDKVAQLETSHAALIEMVNGLKQRVDSFDHTSNNNNNNGSGNGNYDHGPGEGDSPMAKRFKSIDTSSVSSPMTLQSATAMPRKDSIKFPPLPHSNANSRYYSHPQIHSQAPSVAPAPAFAHTPQIPPIPQHQPVASASDNTSASGNSTSSHSNNSKASIALPSLLNPFVESGQDKNFNNKDLPSREIMQKLFNLYFQYVNPIFPILHPTLTHDAFFNSSDSKYIVYGVALVSLKYLNDESVLSSERKIQYYQSWKNIVMLGCFDVSNLDKLITMALLAFESMGQSNDQETWSLVAIVCSGVIHLDLMDEVSGQGAPNNETHTPGSTASTSSGKSISTRSLRLLKRPKSFLEEEQRRHVFWCIYILDRLNSVLSSTSLKLPEAEITCAYPMNTEKWLENIRLPILDSFGFSIQLIKIFGNTHEFNRMKVDITNKNDCDAWYGQFVAIQTDLKNFVDVLPFNYSALLINNNTTNLYSNLSCYDLLLHTLYNITLIKLHSPLGYPHHESDFFKHSNESRAICSNCCNNVLNMINKVGNAHLLFKLGPMYAIFLWIVTRVIIVEHILMQQNYELIIEEATSLKLKTDALLEILDNIGESWAIAKKYSKIIRFLSSSRIKLNDKVQKKPKSTKKTEGSPDQDQEAEEDSEEQEERDPSSIISDMTLNTYFVSLALTNQIEKKEKQENQELAKTAANTTESLSTTFEFNGLSDAAPSQSKFQLDLNSYGFEDFFRYLGDINSV